MRVIRNRPGRIAAASTGGRRSVLTIGNFDGVHRGHLALLGRCVELANDQDQVAVMTFHPTPDAFFRPAQTAARLTTVYQKLSLMRTAGADLVWLMRFDHEFATLTAREFVEQALVRDLRIRCVVIGEDFRFGCGREGDVGLLKTLGGEFGFDVWTVAAVKEDGGRISSSSIRERLAAGDFDRAAEWLGRPYRMEGHVVPGSRLGRKLGYPTANIRIRAWPSPVMGVFAAFARVMGEAWRPAVVNLGRRPAVGGREPLLEVHFFDFDEDLYGQRLEVQFVAKLRDELDFANLEALVAQMKRDEAAARACLAQKPAPD